MYNNDLHKTVSLHSPPMAYVPTSTPSPPILALGRDRLAQGKTIGTSVNNFSTGYSSSVNKKNRKTLTITRTIQGKASDLFQKLQSVGLICIIQTAFVERVNLTFRQAVSPLSRQTWAYAQSEEHLLLHCEWFRTYYHFVRIHESLRLPLAGKKRRYRQRTPAMALGLTDHVWTVSDLLHYPVPQVASIS
jgi:hypothetical protein